jgi:hypothetical protein
MATKKMLPPAKPPLKALARPISRTTLAKLVRDNVITITKDLMTSDKAHNKALKDFQAWEKSGRKNPNEYSEATIEALKNFKAVNPTRWTQSNLGKTLGLSTTVVRRVFATSASKRTGSLSITDVLSLAITLGVSPGYLLQPNKKQLENDSVLQISGLFKQPVKISSHEWFMWIHSLAPLPNMTNEGYELRMAQIDTVEGIQYEEPKQIFTSTEMNRIAESSYFSALSPTLSFHEQFYPQLQREVVGRSHLDDANREFHSADRDLKVLRNKISLMTFVRRAIRLMEEYESEADTKKAINWSLNQMGHALADIARNRKKKLK